MPQTLLTWQYIGGADDSEEAKLRGGQLAYMGDSIIDDILGDGC